MTELIQESIPVTPTASASSPTEALGVDQTAASEAVKRERADAHWSRWQARGAQEDQVARRRLQIIGSVIAVGVTAWLLFTFIF